MYMKVLIGLVITVASFLLGSVYFSKLIAAKVAKTDICKVSYDSNPGAANVWNTCGRKWGFVAFFLDFLKGFLPVVLTLLFCSAHYFWLPFIIVAPVLGSALGLFNKFKGGKSISVAFGVFAGTVPVFYGVAVLIVCYLLFSVVLHIKPNGVSTIVCFSVTALSCLPLALWFNIPDIGIAYMIVCVIVITKHAIKLRNELFVYNRDKA